MACHGRSAPITGPPFASLGLGGLTPLAVWWIKLGITPERIAPGHPEQNGRLERLHRTLKAETTLPAQAQPPEPAAGPSMRSDTATMTSGRMRPSGNGHPGGCTARRTAPIPAGSGHPSTAGGVTVRKVRTNGQIRWHGALIYLSATLHGEPVAWCPKTTATGPSSTALCNWDGWMPIRVTCSRPPPRCYRCPRFRCYLSARLHRG